VNPHLYYLRELEQDGSDDDVSSAFRFVLPFWAAQWADAPASYPNVFYAVAAKVNGLPRTPLRDRMADVVVYLSERRPTPSYTA